MNSKLKAYYIAQKVPSSDPIDQEELFNISEVDLPVCFRIVKNNIHEQWIIMQLKNYEDLYFDGKKLLETIAFKPFFDCYILNITKKELKNNPDYKELFKLLVHLSEAGLIVRQELVSMIPAYILLSYFDTDNIFLLDFCAAPGNKTSQLIEGLRYFRTSLYTEGIERGLVIANDMHSVRAHMLIHQLKFHYANSLIVTLHNSEYYPYIITSDKKQFIKFDGILTDVPCSGDGTVRKSNNIKKNWKPLFGNLLHTKQINILKRGLVHLKCNGYLTYSTCSLNCVENEAVVGHVVSLARDTIELVKFDLRKAVDITYRCGKTNWYVNYKNNYYNKYDEIPIDSLSNAIVKSMFPNDNKDIVNLVANNSMRFYPHDNNSGGFYICVFHKIKPVPWELLYEDATNNTECTWNIQQDYKSLQTNSELTKFVTDEIMYKYGLPESNLIYESIWYKNCLTNSNIGKKVPKHLNIVSDNVKSFLKCYTLNKPMNIINAGTNIIEYKKNLFRFTFYGYDNLVKHIRNNLLFDYSILKNKHNIIIITESQLAKLLSKVDNKLSTNFQNFDFLKVTPNNTIVDSHAILIVNIHNIKKQFIMIDTLIIPIYIGKNNVTLLIPDPLKLAFRQLVNCICYDNANSALS